MTGSALNRRPRGGPPAQAVLPGIVTESRPVGDVSDAWATPADFVLGLGLVRLLPGGAGFSGFVPTLDVCAEAWSAKAPRYYGPGGEREDALAELWPEDEEKWDNPPFSCIDPWAWASLEAAGPRLGAGCTMHLIPPRTDRPWYHEIAKAEEAGQAFRTILLGRLEFAPPPGVKGGNVGGGVELWQVGGHRRRLPPRLVTQAVQELGQDILRGRRTVDDRWARGTEVPF